MSIRHPDLPAVKKEQETAAPETVEKNAVEEAIRVIQRHVDKEARNRWVEHLEVRDLCPRHRA
jgi:hypothetical protein